MKTLKTFSVAAVLVATLILTACPSPQTEAAIWTAAGAAADGFIAVYASNWANKAAFDKAWAAAGTDIANWKNGTACADVVQAINDASALLAQLPVLNQKAVAAMAVIVVSVDTVTSFFSSCNTAAVAKAKAIRASFPPAVQAAADKLAKPKSSDDVKKLWAAAGGPALK